MTRRSALDGLRIGCVRYLNAAPLIHGYEGPILFDHPAALARDLEEGRLDVALAPIYAAFGGQGYLLVDDIAIASRGAVFSVFLAYCRGLPAVRRIAVDPASLTSVYLLRVILAQFYGLHPDFVDAAERSQDADALLLIGNQAIDFRIAHQATHTFLDLGEEWARRTNLPFVYAAWMLRPELSNARAVANSLREFKRGGVSSLPKIVEAETLYEASFRARYLGEHLHYDLGAPEKSGINMFRAMLVKSGLVAESQRTLHYI